MQGRGLAAVTLVAVLASACSPTAPPPDADPATQTAPQTENPTDDAGELRTLPEDAAYGYEDAVRERVTVFSARDDDGDGEPDAFPIDIIRPRDATEVPVILQQSPYWDNVGRGLLGEPRERSSDGTVTMFPLWYDNWFVPQGYAYAIMDSSGSGDSDGCWDNYGLSSQASAVAALDYFAGADWSNGSVAMVGKSADALHALMAAATGHEALDAVVAIGGLTSYAEYTQPGGILVEPFPLWVERSGCETFAQEWTQDFGDGTSPTELTRSLDVLQQLDG
ncbi:CocE/NonD family hydrolase [Ornithinimicrobium sp. Y1694]|uniref:CocE/NonD family hydrolase n=1 Tax=Ornithinimicrobium sp. Y1694 TaxID=3418590 RepID=UPI003CE9CAC9